jgi:hypothetical protein
VARLLSQPCTVSSNKPGYAIVMYFQYKHRPAFSLCAPLLRVRSARFFYYGAASIDALFANCLQSVGNLFANRACLQTPRGPACKSNKQTNTSNKHLFVNCLQTVNKHRHCSRFMIACAADAIFDLAQWPGVPTCAHVLYMSCVPVACVVTIYGHQTFSYVSLTRFGRTGHGAT